MQITEENYYSFEVNQEYMSQSQWGDWLSCPEAAFNQYQTGKYKPKGRDCFLGGSYVHTGILEPYKLQKFIEDNPQLIASSGKNKGYLKKEYQWCDEAIVAVNKQRLLGQKLEGAKEQIYTLEINGYPWKAKIDVDNDDFITDLKTTQNIIEEKWDNQLRRRVPFYEMYGYWRQAAVYRYAKFANGDRWPLYYMIAVSKQSPPDIELFLFNDPVRLETELHEIKGKQEEIWAYKLGKAVPWRCNTCDWCRQTKTIYEAKVL